MKKDHTKCTDKHITVHALLNLMAEKYRRKEYLDMVGGPAHRQSGCSAAFYTMVKAMEAMEYINRGHKDRVQDLVEGFARNIGFPDCRVRDLRLLARFHDIGKLGIPDRILLKPGALSSEEYSEIQRHCEIGYRIARLVPEIAHIADWILRHHEWWNGQGYPLNLKGKEIPLECRMLAIADAYDAMTSDRPHRKSIPHREAVGELRRWAGTQFDPDLVERFVAAVEKVEAD
ncbi:MAG: HD-GYP domain-containing protein [Peptococcaceae bacterium]|nr:HD-GYP domain-containing protein [Peptococcaceae bacterium]